MSGKSGGVRAEASPPGPQQWSGQTASLNIAMGVDVETAAAEPKAPGAPDYNMGLASPIGEVPSGTLPPPYRPKNPGTGAPGNPPFSTGRVLKLGANSAGSTQDGATMLVAPKMVLTMAPPRTASPSMAFLIPGRLGCLCCYRGGWGNMDASGRPFACTILTGTGLQWPAHQGRSKHKEEHMAEALEGRPCARE